MSAHTLVILLIAALTAGLITIIFDFWTRLFAMFILLGSLVYFAAKSDQRRHQLAELERLRDAHSQLDQQAKLIIRTDLELHRTQEALDRKLAAVMALHELGKELLVNLQPDEVFGKLSLEVVTHSGFSKGLLGLSRSFDALEWRSLIGIDQLKANPIREYLLESNLLRSILTNPAPRVIDIRTSANREERRLLELLKVSNAVVAGLIPQAGPTGCLLLGREVTAGIDPQKEIELISILANQLTVAVENCALYEEAWRSRQALERRVQERTRELADANTQLVKLNKAKSDFVSAVSHELRTPLAAIKGYASLLRTGRFGALKSPQTERITKVEKHVDSLTQLVNNLLDIARIESGRVAMELCSIEVDGFFATISDTVRPQLEAKRIRFDINTDDVKELMGDPAHLGRVFVNLLSNAIKYTPEGGKISVRLKRDGVNIVSRVIDSGCGISPTDQPKLFREFSRLPSPENEQISGTGLGLVLVKRIIQAHRGKIWVESQLGKGSEFVFTLPASQS